MPLCWVEVSSWMWRGMISRATLVRTTMSGCTTAAQRFSGIGTFMTSSSALERMRVMPPSRQGATLSACQAPSAAASPATTKGSNWRRVSGAPRSSFTTKAPPTALAALEPRPLPNGIFLWISISTPRSALPRWRNRAWAETPAVFSLASSGKRPPSPVILAIRRPG